MSEQVNDACAAVDVYVRRIEQRKSWGKGAVDPYMHLVWSVGILNSSPAHELPPEMEEILLKACEAERINTGPVVNICL